MQVVGYVRLSKSETNGHGIQVQRNALEEYCARRGFELVRIAEDDGASGRSTRKRPGLARALEALRSEGCGAIVATRVDRLARSSLDFHRIVEEVQKAGATVLFSEQESFSLDTPEGRMLVGSSRRSQRSRAISSLRGRRQRSRLCAKTARRAGGRSGTRVSPTSPRRSRRAS